MLVLLLIMALYASFQSISFVRELITDDYLNRASRQMAEIASAQNVRLSKLTLNTALLEGEPQEVVGGIMGQLAEAGVPVIGAAVVEPDGRVLAWQAMPEASSNVYQAIISGVCSNAAGWLRSFQPAFISVLDQPAILVPCPLAGTSNLCLLVQRLAEEELGAIRETYPEFIGLLPPDAEPPRSSVTRMLRDPLGRRVAQLAVAVDRERVERLAESIALAIRCLTMGFILLAGALGLWAVRSTVHIETRRRLGRFVEEMGYFKDGLVALDRRRRILAWNPAMQVMLGRSVRSGRTRLQDVFPELSGADQEFLFSMRRPREVEKIHLFGGTVRVWRFRSQPADELDLLLVSDVTERRERERLERQAAALQLVGRVARGIAHDFNNILGVISGNAELIRLRSSESWVAEAADQIRRQAMQGADIAARLLDLTRPGEPPPCWTVADSIRKAAEFLEMTADVRCQIRMADEGRIPPVPLGCLQLQHIIISLGMLIRCGGRPTRERETVHIEVGVARRGPPVSHRVEITVGSAPAARFAGQEPKAPAERTSSEAGAVVAMVHSIMAGADGTLSCITLGKDQAYYVTLPIYVTGEETPSSSEGLLQYLERWRVLVALKQDDMRMALAERLARAGATTDPAEDTVSALSLVNSERAYDGIILTPAILGEDPAGLLKAIGKLQPSAGIVMLVGENETVDVPALPGVKLVSSGGAPEEILLALLEAAAQRRG